MPNEASEPSVMTELRSCMIISKRVSCLSAVTSLADVGKTKGEWMIGTLSLV